MTFPLDMDPKEKQEPWMLLAHCRDMDPSLFFPHRGDSIQPAMKACSTCIVRSICLDYALSRNERYGIWGGETEHDRRQLRRDLGLVHRPRPDAAETVPSRRKARTR